MRKRTDGRAARAQGAALMHQALKSSRLACPACSGELERVARSPLDRLLGLLVPSRRYRCTRGACGWSGLLQARARRA